MKRKYFAVGVAVSAGIIFVLSGWAKQGTITQEELVRNTQELMDAVAVGNQAPFQKYYADDVLFSDEKGRNMDKAALVKDITPLPAGYSGTIKVVQPQSRIVGDTAILSYELDDLPALTGENFDHQRGERPSV